MKPCALLIALLALSSAARAEPTKVWHVDEVVARLSQLDGQVVRIRGWISGCDGGLDCYIESRPEAERARSHTITIDFVSEVEPWLSRLSGKQVILESRVTAACRTTHICTDRAPDVVPIRVVRTRR